MPRINSLHKAATGRLAGQWVGCPAQVSCRNGGVHISRDDMRDLKNALKEHTGRFVPMGEITAEDASKYLEALEILPTAVEKDKGPVTDYKNSFSADVVKNNISRLNSLTGGRARSLDAARIQVVEQYEAVADALSPEEVVSGLYESVGGDPKGQDFSNVKVSGGVLTVTNLIEGEYKGEYQDRLREVLGFAREPDSFNAVSWEDAEYTTDPYSYDYFDDYDEEEKEGTVTRNFTITEEQQKQYTDAMKKKGLSKFYPVAADESFPSWALNGGVYGQSAQVKNKISILTRSAGREFEAAQKKYDAAYAKVRVAQRRLAEVNVLTRKIDEAKRVRETMGGDEVTVEALDLYVKSVGAKKVAAEKAYNIAARASTPAKLDVLRQKRDDAYRGQQAVAVEAAGALYMKYAVEWLTERFPARNGNARRAAARAWVREHPEVVAKINNLP